MPYSEYKPIFIFLGKYVENSFIQHDAQIIDLATKVDYLGHAKLNCCRSK